jgi:GT2 family glycosyltransferase
MRKSVFVVIPNFNGARQLAAAVDSVLAQSYKDFDLIIVDNGSSDNSRAIIEKYQAQDKRVRSVFRRKNYGYTGGVNPGMELAIRENADFVAPFNNDAVADKDWLKHLVAYLKAHNEAGIAACKLLHLDGQTFDSTADLYTIWGLPYPRGRDEPVSDKYDRQTEIFGASGGASLYRVAMLREIGLFDQDFFAYYEDIDLSFRAHLAGWKVAFVPKSVVYHAEGMTSKAMASGFTTYQFMKNVPMVLIKDVPGRLWLKVAWRLWLAYTLFFLNAVWQARGWSALKGWARGLVLLPNKLAERRRIQRARKVPVDYISSIITHDLPPNAHKLRQLRTLWWRFTGRRG